MNSLEKKSFYSFLGLYLFSSFLFVLLAGYWYYSAQKNSLDSETYYKLTHFADKLSGRIINAQMQNRVLSLPNTKEFEYELIHTNSSKDYTIGYFEKDGYKILVSDAPQEHLNVKYVLVKTQAYFKELVKLQKSVFLMMSIAFVCMGIIAFYLSRIFMKPLHTRVMQIENFIQDVTHELNTPITALGMSASRAIKKEVYDKKLLTNISISTKQLETIYKSLTYLNFTQTQESIEEVELLDVVQRVVKYYAQLSDAKKIVVKTELSSTSLLITESRAELLVSNLLSNAIKYSMPETTITIRLQDAVLSIEDEGVGIAKDKLQAIFELYKRDSNIAGGFGVGLSIVKQICDEYNIKVEVASKLGEGSEFRLLLKA